MQLDEDGNQVRDLWAQSRKRSCYSNSELWGRAVAQAVVDCRLVDVMGWDYRLSTAALALLYYPRMRATWASDRRDWLGLTPNLTTRALWSTETPLEQWEIGEGNENLVYPSSWDFKSSFTCRPVLLPIRRKVWCGFLLPLKILRLGRFRTRNLWVQWQVH
jgi:hypothetical protein